MGVRVAFGGSRVLGARWLPLVSRVVAGCVASGASSFSVGCAVGADALCLGALVRAGVASRVSVFAVGSASGAGFWSGSALGAVRAASVAGASVSWLAGGSLGAALRVRLAARSRACVAFAGAGGVACFFLARPRSFGSFGAARAAVRAGCSVVVFCCGFGVEALPLLFPVGGFGAGAWVPVRSGVFSGGFVWRVAP